jgi:hypothetical protein
MEKQKSSNTVSRMTVILSVGGAAIIIVFVLSMIKLFTAGENEVFWADMDMQLTLDADQMVNNMEEFKQRFMLGTDITSVSAFCEDQKVILLTVLNKKVKSILSALPENGKKMSYSITEYYIDADNNTATGVKLPWEDAAKRPLDGYDFKVVAMLGYDYKDKNTGEVHRVTGDGEVDTGLFEIVRGFATYTIVKLDDSRQDTLLSNDGPEGEEFEKLSGMDGTLLESQVPYETLGIRAGDKVRICYREVSEGAGKGLSDDRVLDII